MTKIDIRPTAVKYPWRRPYFHIERIHVDRQHDRFLVMQILSNVISQGCEPALKGMSFIALPDPERIDETDIIAGMFISDGSPRDYLTTVLGRVYDKYSPVSDPVSYPCKFRQEQFLIKSAQDTLNLAYQQKSEFWEKRGLYLNKSTPYWNMSNWFGAVVNLYDPNDESQPRSYFGTVDLLETYCGYPRGTQGFRVGSHLPIYPNIVFYPTDEDLLVVQSEIDVNKHYQLNK